MRTYEINRTKREINRIPPHENAEAIENLFRIIKSAYEQRDAAVEDLRCAVIGTIHACDYCKKNDPKDFKCENNSFTGCDEWEWRGQKKK